MFIEQRFEFAAVRLILKPFLHTPYILARIPQDVVLRSDAEDLPVNILDPDPFLLPDRMPSFGFIKHRAGSHHVFSGFGRFLDFQPILGMPVRIR